MNLSRKWPIIILLLLASFNLSANTKRALLIGIDKYVETKETPTAFATASRGGLTNLDGCVNDAKAMRSIIQSRYGFLNNNIDTLFNSAASHDGIIEGINKLIATAKAGDVVFIFYAGHGSQVKNSKSYDGTGQDQTIVPADQWDIRNKELSKLFNQLVDNGVTLTLIFDCCHSGSIARGSSLPVDYKERKAPPANWDAQDSSHYPAVEQRGALVFSAAQRAQTAKEAEDIDKTPHGAFTLALIRAINSSSSNQSAEKLYARIQGTIKSEGGPKQQDPILGGSIERRKGGLFGEVANENSTKTFVAVLDVTTGEVQGVTLRGGHELSIYEGCLFVDASGKDTLEVISVNGIGKCETVVKGKGKISSFKSGDLVELVNWVRPDGPTLRIWKPETNFTAEQLMKVVEPVNALMDIYYVKVMDPTVISPDYVIQFNNNKWMVSSSTSAPVILTSLNSATLKAAIPKGKKVFLQLPPTSEIIASLNKKLGPGTPSSAIEFTKNPLQANYILAGRINNAVLEYSLLRPNVSEMDSSFRNSLPLRTDWFKTTSTESCTDSLSIFAVRLGKISSWLNLESPVDNFPYQLILIRNKTNQIMSPGDKMSPGENYHFGLLLDSVNAPMNAIIVRYCYIFTIDCKGKMSLFYPDVTFGSENNAIKYVPFSKTRLDIFPNKGKVEFQMDPRGPFGFDTYFLVTSDVPLNTDVFESDGVITRAGSKPNQSALDNLFANNGAKTRGPQPPVATHWSVQKFQYQSVPKGK